MAYYIYVGIARFISLRKCRKFICKSLHSKSVDKRDGDGECEVNKSEDRFQLKKFNTCRMRHRGSSFFQNSSDKLMF